MKRRLLPNSIDISLCGALQAQRRPQSFHHVPVQKSLSEVWTESLFTGERKMCKGDELETIGMPCGGITAGHFCFDEIKPTAGQILSVQIKE